MKQDSSGHPRFVNTGKEERPFYKGMTPV